MLRGAGASLSMRLNKDRRKVALLSAAIRVTNSQTSHGQLSAGPRTANSRLLEELSPSNLGKKSFAGQQRLEFRDRRIV